MDSVMPGIDYHLALLLIFTVLGTLFFTFLFFNEFRKEKALEKIRTLPFKKEYETYLDKTPHYRKLHPEDQQKIQRSIIYFIHTKKFIGIGLQVSDEMKIIIAFYACLLLIGKNTPYCYDKLKTIIIYPHAVMIKQVRSYGGIYAKEQFMIEGQSADETVVITWHEAKNESYHMRHNNVILHEFAHEIDFMDGQIDGVPPLEHSKYDGWVKTLYKELDQLNTIVQKNRDWGKYKLLDGYAATNEAEFFAVVTERFFESPAALKLHFPDLYEEYKDFYQIDTAELFL
ncbi:MAG: zinc-dependent peptidase [Sulfuricurvum sp.]|uniref:M90 family metallopeptidase n=1 Tax=Sulfuricurvum sp. TaxID=2025608 RepID=UPI0026119810|nr:M90 family metallopeptidase [Sulfuricurvum sp.]MDD5119088.1 zinc-dependent peptidase [Sulfuricurvum sp.]